MTPNEVAQIKRDIRTLQSARIAWLMGVGPESVTVSGYTICNEAQAEGYLFELEAALREVSA